MEQIELFLATVTVKQSILKRWYFIRVSVSDFCLNFAAVTEMYPSIHESH